MNQETETVQQAGYPTADYNPVVITSKDAAFAQFDAVPLMAKLEKQTFRKVQLIYPAFHEAAADGVKESYLSAVLPPLGMLYVAAQVEKAGYNVRVIDAEAEQLSNDQTIQLVKEFQPDLVGIYCTTANFKQMVALADHLKKAVHCAIFFGGPHGTYYGEETAMQDPVDIVFLGEAEQTTPEVLQILQNKGIGLHRVPGIMFQYNGKIIKTDDRPFVKNLDDLAFPAFHLVDVKKYRPSPQHILRTPSITMITTRGCPFKCTFCHVPVLFKDTYRQRSVENVIAEIKELKAKYGIKEVQFYDDLFGANKIWLEKFLDTIITERLDITWSCLTRIDTLHKDLVQKMRKAGNWCIFFGMESLDNNILKAINKKLTVEQIEKAIVACKEAGIEIRANFILGSPNETPEIAKKMIKRICELNPDYVKFNVMTPYPGNPIYEQIKAGLWGKMVEEDYAKLTNHEVVFVPFGYKNAEEVIQMRRYAYRKFYFRPKYVLSRLGKLRSWHGVKRHMRGVKLIVSRYII